MIADEKVLKDRNKFAETAKGYWEKIQENNSRSANAATRAGDRIVAHWKSIGRAAELLVPLLASKSPEVRFSAASHLLALGMSDDAVPVLEELQCRPTGFVAIAAQLALRKWRKDSATERKGVRS